MSTKKLDEDSITLDEYSTFQYMLSPPTNTKKITDQITSFVFYNKPCYKEKEREDVIESKNIIVEGEVTCINYYCCCLILLPSHILGMSKWISAEDYYNQSSSSSEHNINLNLKSGDILRRFRYSFYCNFLLVETHHICVESHDERGVGKEVHPKKFRLVEYMTCPISLWLVANTVFTLAALFISYSLHFACGMFNGSTSFAILIVSVLACFHFILLLTGVRMW